jgi:alanine--tRNA ligase
MTSKDIRQGFLDFFREKQHAIVPSSSLLPDAPNLLFTNAGMNQFVPIFLGQTNCPYSPGRAADTQKCIRAGGKHNDLEDVGLDTYHHTLFEMLGNWSFGDYFKREAIDWAWELLTTRWKFPPARLYATYFGGDDKIPADTEARDLWLRYLPADHVVPGNRKDNFWMMGDTGPCGPCSELHVDLTPEATGGAKLVNAGTPQCIEIWNLVFIQFNAAPDGSLSPLPAKHVDTGMGFERVASIIQCTKNFTDFNGVISNYETDVFTPIFRKLEELSGKKYTSTLPSNPSGTIGLRACAVSDSDKSGITTFRSKTRNLPHWQEGGSTYFVTFTTREKREMSPAIRDLVLAACRHNHEKQYHLHAVTVMPDHVHLLLWPIPLNPAQPEKGYTDLSDILHSIKSYTANQIQRQFGWEGAVWERESFDRIIRNEEEFVKQWNYIAGNAATKGLSQGAEDYPWFWSSGTRYDETHDTAQARRPMLPDPAQLQTDIAFRVIADHIRCLSFAVADGILPSNEGRGYVLRRILRRAVRYGRNLGFHEPFFHKLVGVVADNFGHVFPELKQRREKIEQTLRGEEENFNRTLDRGIEIFEETVAGLKTKTFPAPDAFKLYDTYGFPIDLTELMARERGLTVDVTGFENLMEEQRQRAREDHARKKTVVTVASEGIEVKPTNFLGYDNLESEAVVETVAQREENAFNLILDRTPFYAEMGGQVGDTGLVHVPGHDWSEVGRLTVLDTQKQGDLHVHVAKVANGRAPEVGEAVRLAVDAGRRANIQRHHTVTHIFHWALHEVVSKDARQRGSLVAPDRLRFDFNHPEKLTDQQLADIERLVNDHINRNETVNWFEVPYADIRSNPDVMQFFGDKYGDTVRVVQIGGHAGRLDGFSMELCGGTHTKSTGEIGLFKITKESAIAAGIRRIEAVCGTFAEQFLAQQRDLEQAEAEKAVAREREKEQAKQRQAEMQSRAPELAAQLLTQGNRIIGNLGDANADLLRAVVDAIKPRLASGAVVLGGASEGKVALICYVTADLIKQGKQAGKVVGELAKLCGGGGGGKPDLAQAGGRQPENLDKALARAKELIGS